MTTASGETADQAVRRIIVELGGRLDPEDERGDHFILETRAGDMTILVSGEVLACCYVDYERAHAAGAATPNGKATLTFDKGDPVRAATRVREDLEIRVFGWEQAKVLWAQRRATGARA